MIRVLALFVIFAMLGTLIQAETDRPNDGLPLVRADYPLCVTIQPPPIRAPRKDVFKPGVNGDFS
jgi:hypothetical protein